MTADKWNALCETVKDFCIAADKQLDEITAQQNALSKRITDIEARITLTNERLERLGEWVSKHTTG